MTSLVLELQHEALNPNVKVSDLLRKALVVSKKLGVSEIEAWINKELNGYEGGGDTPEYRMAHGRVMVDDPRSGMIPVYFKYQEKSDQWGHDQWGQTRLLFDQRRSIVPVSTETEARKWRAYPDS